MLAEDDLEDPSAADSAADPGSAALHQREKELQRMVSEDDVELCLAFATLKELLASKRLKASLLCCFALCIVPVQHSLQRQRSSGKVIELCMLTYKQHTGKPQLIGIVREREVLKRAKVLHNEELAEQIKLEKARSAHEETLANLEQLESERERLAAELAELEQRDTMLRYEARTTIINHSQVACNSDRQHSSVCCQQKVFIMYAHVGELHSTKGDLEVQLEDLRLENDHLVRPELDRLRDLKAAAQSELEAVSEAQRRDTETKDVLSASCCHFVVASTIITRSVAVLNTFSATRDQQQTLQQTMLTCALSLHNCVVTQHYIILTSKLTYMTTFSVHTHTAVLWCRWEAAAVTKHELEAALSAGKLALSKLKSEPERARKQADSVERAAVALKAEVERLHTRAQESAAELAKMESKRAEAEELRKSLNAKVDLHRETIGHRQRDVEAVTKSIDQERTRHHHLLTERLEIELKRREADEWLHARYGSTQYTFNSSLAASALSANPSGSSLISKVRSISCLLQVADYNSSARHEGDALSVAKKEFDALKRKLKKKRTIACVTMLTQQKNVCTSSAAQHPTVHNAFSELLATVHLLSFLRSSSSILLYRQRYICSDLIALSPELPTCLLTRESPQASARETVPLLKSQLEKAKSELSTQVEANAALEAQAEQLRQDVDVGIAKFLTQESIELNKREELRVLVEGVDALEAQVLLWAEEEAKQNKLVALLSAQREIKATEAMRAAAAERDTAALVKVKGLAVLDLAKRCHDVNNRLREFGALYDVVKNERNKYVNLIQASHQALAEMREKIKILQNEVDILRNESVAKDKALQKERAALQQSQAQRDALRLDSNRAAGEYASKQEAVEQQITEIEKLNAIINGLEREMLRLKARYETAIEGNYCGAFCGTATFTLSTSGGVSRGALFRPTTVVVYWKPLADT
eukprot:1035-Heterococcus_DN1.PRE.3